MHCIKAKDYTDMSRQAAMLVAAQLLAKPDSVLGFATGSTPVGMYEELVRLCQECLLDFSQAATFNLDEYYGVPRTDKNSYHHFMDEKLFSHINIRRDAVHLPDGMAPDAQAQCREYEEKIAAAGGIDLQVLGIGHNGHIGFNEPADNFATVTQHIKLSERTIDANARFYPSRDDVPASALSMGVGTIMRARSIVLLISGADKKAIAEQALYGPVTPQVPASILQFHPNVTVLLAVE